VFSEIERSVLESLYDPQGPDGLTAGNSTAQPADRGVPTVTGAHLARALDDLLDSAQGVTRTLLGVGVDPATLPAGGALGMSPGMVMAQHRMAGGRPGPRATAVLTHWHRQSQQYRDFIPRREAPFFNARCPLCERDVAGYA